MITVKTVITGDGATFVASIKTGRDTLGFSHDWTVTEHTLEALLSRIRRSRPALEEIFADKDVSELIRLVETHQTSPADQILIESLNQAQEQLKADETPKRRAEDLK